MRMFWVTRSLLVLSCALMWVGIVSGADQAEPNGATKDVQILYHESVQSLQFAPLGQADRAAGEDALAGVLSFDAFGQRFELILESNDRLIADLPDEQKDRIRATHQLYKGHIDGIDGSWARLTQSGNQWTGMIWDGVTLYAIEPQDTVASSLQSTPSSDATSTIIYRLSDMNTSGSCALDPTAQPLHDYQGLLNELNQLPPVLSAATARLNVSVVGDVAFDQNQSNPEGVAASLFNAVDGIYQDQVGIEINVVRIEILSNNGNLASSSPQTLLNQLSSFSNSPNVDNPGLLHLLTGRNLNGGTIGIAFLGSLCSNRFGVGISEIRSGGMASNVVLIAHEIGHNTGAPHDNQGGSACSSTPSGFIMNPSINGSSDTFSSCSVQQMRPEIANAGCIEDLPGDDDDDNVPLFSADFNSDRDGFDFEEDVNANNVPFTRGQRVSNAGVNGSGALQINLGGVNNARATNMEANWTRRFNGSGSVTLRLDASLLQTPHYERDEVSEIGVVLDGQAIVIARIRGNGNGGSNRTTGFRSFSRNLNLGNGAHTLSLNCFNNKKTFNNERTVCLFDNVRIE